MGDNSGRIIKGYELFEQIGSGGFGAVYRAEQPALGREVAVKIILPKHANQPDFIRRFEVEAHLVARLEHPHIVPLHDYWRDPSGAYIVMRYLREGSLKDAIHHEAFNLELTAKMLDQVASALAFTLHHVVALSAHFDGPLVPLASLGVFLGGLTWSFLYLRYRSVWPCYVSHAIVDLPIFWINPDYVIRC